MRRLRLGAATFLSPLRVGDWKAAPPIIALLLCAAASGAEVDGMTALHWAAQRDDLAKVKTLLAAGEDAKLENRYGVTPLSLACVNGNEGIITALLDAGVDANTTLRGGESVLMTASRTGKPGPVKALLAHGAKVDATDRKGQTALMWAAADGHVAVVELLIAAGADFRKRLKSGFTPLLFAAREGRSEVVRALLKAGADVNDAIETDKKTGGRAPDNGTSTLTFAVENGHFELAIALVKAGANPNDQRTGFTPLHTLTWVRKPSRGDDEAGAPPPDGSGNITSLDFVRQIVALGAKVDAPLGKDAKAKGKLSMVGATPFFIASKNADLAYMKLLVELGADPHRPNKDGTTPLMTAAGLGCFAPTEEAGTETECVEAVAYLLTLGLDINAVDENGETAMHGAAYKSLPKMVQFLADKGAKLDVWNRKNKFNWTPLLLAEGYRPGNFRPSADTIAAIHKVMLSAGVTPPPPTVRPDDDGKPKKYEP